MCENMAFTSSERVEALTVLSPFVVAPSFAEIIPSNFGRLAQDIAIGHSLDTPIGLDV